MGFVVYSLSLYRAKSTHTNTHRKEDHDSSGVNFRENQEFGKKIVGGARGQQMFPDLKELILHNQFLTVMTCFTSENFQK